MSGEPLPEGVEINILIYITSPGSDVDMVVKLNGASCIPDFDALIAKSPLPTFQNIKDWRRMTREEIASYKANVDVDPEPT